jgi:hypothetical protein
MRRCIPQTNPMSVANPQVSQNIVGHIEQLLVATALHPAHSVEMFARMFSRASGSNPCSSGCSRTVPRGWGTRRAASSTGCGAPSFPTQANGTTAFQLPFSADATFSSAKRELKWSNCHNVVFTANNRGPVGQGAKNISPSPRSQNDHVACWRNKE